MTIGFIEAMKFPMGYGSQRERIQIETERQQETQEGSLNQHLAEHTARKQSFS